MAEVAHDEIYDHCVTLSFFPSPSVYVREPGDEACTGQPVRELRKLSQPKYNYANYLNFVPIKSFSLRATELSSDKGFLGEAKVPATDL